MAATAFEVNILKRPTILSPVLHTNLRKRGKFILKQNLQETCWLQFRRSCVTNAQIDGCSVKKNIRETTKCMPWHWQLDWICDGRRWQSSLVSAAFHVEEFYWVGPKAADYYSMPREICQWSGTGYGLSMDAPPTSRKPHKSSAVSYQCPKLAVNIHSAVGLFTPK